MIQAIQPISKLTAAITIGSILLSPFSLLLQQGLYGPHRNSKQDLCQATWVLARS
jgi:hypothetical protein